MYSNSEIKTAAPRSLKVNRYLQLGVGQSYSKYAWPILR